MTTQNKNKNTGYGAWLGYSSANRDDIRYLSTFFNSICIESEDSVLLTARQELEVALKEIFGQTPVSVKEPKANGTVVLSILSKECAKLADKGITKNEADRIGDEGYIVKSCSLYSNHFTIIAAKSGVGVLYGVFALIRHILCGDINDNIQVIDNPSIALRTINHWDNMDGSIERGYAGQSIFYRNGRILINNKRIRDYARLLASVGINGIVLNNVNVHSEETKLITTKHLPNVSKLADLFRLYGIKTFLSINYSSPIELGGLDTADPLDKEVQSWWKEKAAEIYSYIPDFGGFLVKADSEFRPGPFTYGRNHVEGANVLAAALKPFGGILIWRCFVYNCKQDWRDKTTDRANAAYDNFMPLDGEFDDNVLLQIKNGPMDFQVREPVSPLLGGLKKSNIVLELQITQEYTGQQRHLCYLSQIWKNTLDFDTHSRGNNSTVASLLTQGAKNGEMSGITAVSNIGDDMNWTGHDLAQSNLYCFGRLAWNPSLTSEAIAKEWIIQTFGRDDIVIDTLTGMLIDSYKIYESYTVPLGIGWMVNPHHHYGPNVDGYEYSPWGTYHRADHNGIGVDRTVATGTGNTGRYFPPNSTIYENPETCPEELLLFFHHIPYKYKLKSGVTLIQHIYDTHFEGAEKAAELVDRWQSLHNRINLQCSQRVLERLEEQAAHACEWRDVINSYFLRKSGIQDEKSRKIY